MKKLNFLFALLLLLSIFTFSECKKDPTPCELLEGNWQCESWKEDGDEQLGSAAYISYSKIDFDKLDENKGDFDWSVNYNDGTSDVITGKYEVNTTCSEITLTFINGYILDLDFVILNDKLTLEGNDDGIAVDIDFKKD
jgi:Lipocalin-like domain